MNERIEELYQQSFIEVYDENSFPCMTFSKKRFAELIVEECIDVCKSRVGNADYNTGRLHCVSDIREHFRFGMSTEDKKTLIKELLGVKND
jgi:uncharacterized membrane protein